VALSEAHGVSPASVVLRWLLQRGIAAIPKTNSPARLVENLHGPFGWALNEEGMSRVSGLDEGLHCRGDDPATMA
jgi:diketogulonate reductase-like aldo/keto reductase